MLSIVKGAIFDSTTMGYIGSPFGLGLSCQLWVGLKMLKFFFKKLKESCSNQVFFLFPLRIVVMNIKNFKKIEKKTSLQQILPLTETQKENLI
jgi:hypothetical protein